MGLSVTISSSLLFLFLFIFLTTPQLQVISATPNPDLGSISKATKGSGGGGGGGGSSEELWCVAKNNAEDSTLQGALDWACGPGGTDCGPIQNGGPCYDPQNFQSTASYAFNDYYIKHGSSDDACDFGNTAAITSLDPSHDNCKFPSSALMVSNGSFVGSATASGPGGSDINGCDRLTRWGQPLITLSSVLIIININFLTRT